MKPDGCLAGPGPTLHGEQPVERGADDLVLLGLDGGDDVEHLSRTGPLELGQQRVPATQPGGAGVVLADTEEVVGHGDDGAAVHHDLAAASQPEGVLGTGPVEGDRDGGPPVDHDRVGSCVLDMTAADVPRGALLLVDAPEEEGTRAVGEERHPSGQGGDVVQIGVPGADQVPQEPLGSFPHAASEAHSAWSR